MNKQEAIEYINELPILIGTKESGSNPMINKLAALQLIEQINEPQKVVISKFVAKWIEENREKEHLSMFWKIIAKFESEEISSKDREIYEWYIDFHEKDFVFALAFGYEVEKEKLYTVEIPNPKKSYEHAITLKRTFGGDIVIYSACSNGWKDCYRYQLTEAEIKKDFTWAWNAGFAEEVVEAK